MFNDARLGIASVKNRHLAAGPALGNQVANLINQPVGLKHVACRLHHPNGLARARIGPKVLAEPARVIRNKCIGRIKNMAAGAVVLLKLNLVGHREFTLKPMHVLDVRTPKGVDALIVVAHGKDACGG